MNFLRVSRCCFLSARATKTGSIWRAISAGPPTPKPTLTPPVDNFETVFKFPYIKTLVAISRLKINVTVMAILSLPFVIISSANGHISPAQVSASVLLVGCSILSLIAMGELCRRIVGILYLDRSTNTVKIAHLTFWGRRNDLIVSVNDILPLSECENDTSDIIWTVQFYDKKKRSLMMCTKLGGIERPDLFTDIFKTV